MTWIKISRNDKYSVNEFGEVRNDDTGKLKKPFLNKGNQYLTVDLWRDNKSLKIPVHRLVAEAFIPNPDKKPIVDHIDGNRQNNALNNLRWATYAENNSRFDTIGVRSERIKVTHYIERRKKRGDGHDAWIGSDNIMYFDRIKDAAEMFGCNQSNITLMLKSGEIGRRGKMRGYKFEYMRKV